MDHRFQRNIGATHRRLYRRNEICLTVQNKLVCVSKDEKDTFTNLELQENTSSFFVDIDTLAWYFLGLLPIKTTVIYFVEKVQILTKIQAKIILHSFCSFEEKIYIHKHNFWRHFPLMEYAIKRLIRMWALLEWGLVSFFCHDHPVMTSEEVMHIFN